MASGLHQELAGEIVTQEGVVMMVGAPDTGKSTLSKMVLKEALAQGKTVAYIDGDLAQSIVGPPTCIGLRMLGSEADLCCCVSA